MNYNLLYTQNMRIFKIFFEKPSEKENCMLNTFIHNTTVITMMTISILLYSTAENTALLS